MVAHLWAHQMQDHARNSGSNFYFHDEHIYSYGSHFRCGSVVRNREGQTAYLITDRTYSSTTGRHMAHVRNAIPAHRMVFTTDRLVETRNDKLTEYFYRQAIYYIVDRVERIDELAYKQKRARRCDYISDIEDELCEISRWIEFWGLAPTTFRGRQVAAFSNFRDALAPLDRPRGLLAQMQRRKSIQRETQISRVAAAYRGYGTIGTILDSP